MADKKIKSYVDDRKSAWETMTDAETKKVLDFGAGYIDFLNTALTERLAADIIIAEAKKAGYKDFASVINGKTKFKAGDKYFYNIHEKSVILANTGSEDPSTGLNIVGSHIDAPRLDFKPNPIVEDGGFAYAKTHYYGGIKKYQWTTIPLRLEGVVFTKTGKKVTLSIGGKPEDPKFVITDLLPHLAQEQVTKPASEVVPGEKLNILLGSRPLKDEERNPIKTLVLDYLNKNYGIDEVDFNRAEIEAVPAFNACDIGLDRSMTGGYAQDDRVCAYASLKAMLEIKKKLTKTAICYFSDKEEIGSMGNTGARSAAFRTFVAELCFAYSNKNTDIRTGRALANSCMLSADVTAGFDPLYGDAYDNTNCSFCGRGIALEKYTGARGKSGASDANPEFISKVTGLFDKEKVHWQMNEMGRIDLGGGGTIAQYMADLGINVIDCGVPVLSMHAPFEVTSKADLYWTYRAYGVFLTKMSI